MVKEPGFTKPKVGETDFTLEVSIIIPVYCEAEGITAVVKRVRQVMDGLDRNYEIIVVDDGSDDGTAKKAKEAGARVISHPYNIGNGAAIKTGIREAHGETLVMIDGDGQHAPEDIPRLLEKMDAYDMAVGARTGDSKASFHRTAANRIYNCFATYMCKRRIEDLSYGNKKKVGIVQGLLHSPKLVLLDEPTSGLDPISARDFDALILKLRSLLGLTIVMVSHDLQSIYDTLDRVAIIDNKKIAYEGSLNNIKSVDSEFIQTFFGKYNE